jgi:hypothetical protein
MIRGCSVPNAAVFFRSRLDDCKMESVVQLFCYELNE